MRDNPALGGADPCRWSGVADAAARSYLARGACDMPCCSLVSWPSSLRPLPGPPVTDRNGARDFFAARLYEAMANGFVALDREWRFAYVNARAGVILGREPASLIGRNVWAEFPESRSGAYFDACERAISTQTPVVAAGCFAPGCDCTSRLFPSDDGLLI